MLFRGPSHASHETFCVLKPSAQTHTAAPHCGSHCHPAPRSFNTASSLLLQRAIAGMPGTTLLLDGFPTRYEQASMFEEAVGRAPHKVLLLDMTCMQMGERLRLRQQESGGKRKGARPPRARVNQRQLVLVQQ